MNIDVCKEQNDKIEQLLEELAAIDDSEII